MFNPTLKEQFNLSQTIKVALAFILFAAIGTISHEFGHIAVAECLGYDTKLHYGSMSSVGGRRAELKEYFTEHEEKIMDSAWSKEKEIHSNMHLDYSYDRFYIICGGPIQTILVGCFGLGLLFYRRKSVKEYGFKFFDWLSVMLSLFWLREPFNLTGSVFSGLVKGKSLFGGDELKINHDLRLPDGTIPIALGLMGFLIALYVIFKFVPPQSRLNFIVGGFFGGILGAILWLKILGPVILP